MLFYYHYDASLMKTGGSKAKHSFIMLIFINAPTSTIIFIKNASEKYQDQCVRKQQLSSLKRELITWQHESSKVSAKDI